MLQRERERERERERDTETETETETERQRETERDRERQRQRQRDRDRERERDLLRESKEWKICVVIVTSFTLNCTIFFLAMSRHISLYHILLDSIVHYMENHCMRGRQDRHV